jgi:hypothetical protein
LIQLVLPLLLCLIPVLLACTVAAAIEVNAREFYSAHLTWMDVLILSLGAVLFVMQMILAWRALHWRGTNFDERPDSWLTHLAQAAEWFPLLGLLGTVAAILQTFGSITDFSPPQIIKSYAPAITATGSGLFMALINILPSWLVPVGRDLIRTLGGADAAAPPAPATTIPAAASAPVSAPARAARPPAGADTGS